MGRWSPGPRDGTTGGRDTAAASTTDERTDQVKASEIAPGDVLMAGDSGAVIMPPRTEYTVVSLERTRPNPAVGEPEYVLATVRYTVDGGLGVRRWLPEDEVPLVHPGPDGTPPL